MAKVPLSALNKATVPETVTFTPAAQQAFNAFLARAGD